LKKDGISLLIFVIRAPRIGEASVKTYRVFYKRLCQISIPIVLVASGLEENDRDVWWPVNKGGFQEQKMRFNGQACVTATKRKAKKAG
jgi:hypothetical protein